MTCYLNKVLILDENIAFRRRCREILEPAGSFLVMDGDETGLLELIHADSPSIVLIGPNQDRDKKTDLLGLMSLCWPECRVILIDENPEDRDILDQVGAGAVGYLGCENLDRFLAKAVQKVHEGEAWVPRKMIQGLVGRLRSQV